MITLTRNQVRRLRAVFRRSTLGITHRGIVSELVLRVEGTQLRAQHRYVDLAVEHVEPGNHPPAPAVAIPLDALADFEGAADTPVTLETKAPDQTVVRWEDHGIPQSREYHLLTPADRLEPMPVLPACWTANPSELIDALAEAIETSTDDSTRYALNCVQLQSSRGQVVATDGRQLLVRTGFTFPWPADLLIKGRPVFACRTLPRDQPVEVGWTDTHVFFRAGGWTIACVIQRDLRFPAVDRVIPQPAEVTTHLRLDPDDAGFLESALGRLPGAGDINAPVTIEVNGEVAVRATSVEQPNRVTELVLGRSNYTGSPTCILTNRALVERALRMGFRELGFTSVETPFVCRDAGRVYAVQPLSGGLPPAADAEVIRIESTAAVAGKSQGPTRTASPRRTVAVRESRNGHEQALPPIGRPAMATRAAETIAGPGPEPPGTSLAELIQEAESLHASLADAKSRTARLIAGLRRQRRQSKLVQETLRSLRALKLQDVVA